MENKLTKVTNKLIHKTDNGELSWHIIDGTLDIYNSENSPIKDFLEYYQAGLYLYDNNYDSGKFNLQKSYFTRFKEGTIYLFNFNSPLYGEYYFVAVQKNSTSALFLIDEYESSCELNNKNLTLAMSLAFSVACQLQDPEDFIEQILND